MGRSSSTSWRWLGFDQNPRIPRWHKRIGAISRITFLDINGYRLHCTEAEETAMVLRAAASEIAGGEWTAWIVKNFVAD